MKCYYEVLGVDEKVEEEDLRKAYRRLALQLHPDKNLNNEEEAKQRFQEIQGAYEVLSDSQERAFYDRNRESILHGEATEKREEKLDFFEYFTASCYSGFNDSDKGFYTVYRRVFENIAAKDLKYNEDLKIPNFGQSDTNLEEVSSFYGYWQSYCTSLTFFWVDEIDVRQAQNRWVEKRVVKENKKLRDKAKKEFNEHVRALVAFVKKRDKRWVARKKQMEERIVENKLKQQQFQMEQQEKRLQWMKETEQEREMYRKQYEKQFKAMSSQYASEWGLSSPENSDSSERSESESEECLDELYCIACDKLFKSDKAFKNHEGSKKHKEKEALLRSQMQDEETEFQTVANSDQIDDDNNGSIEVQNTQSSKKKKKKNKQNKVDIIEEVLKPRKSKRNKQSWIDDFGKLDVDSEEITPNSERKSEETAQNSSEKNDDFTGKGEESIEVEKTSKCISEKGDISFEFCDKSVNLDKNSIAHLDENSIAHLDENSLTHLDESSIGAKHNFRYTSSFTSELGSNPKIYSTNSCKNEEIKNKCSFSLNENPEESRDLPNITNNSPKTTNISGGSSEKFHQNPIKNNTVTAGDKNIEKMNEKSLKNSNSTDVEDKIHLKPKLKGKKGKDDKKKGDILKKPQNICGVCNGEFDSKNKLFGHLKSSGHAVPIAIGNKTKKNSKR